jgi:ribonuclease HI
VYKQTTKFEDWRTAFEFFDKGSFFTKFDLKSGYHHVDIFLEHQPFLGFSWKMDKSTTSYFMFTVLPFGLTSAPFIFTKLIRPLVKLWRSKGITNVVYLDDGFDIERNIKNCTDNASIIQSDLHQAGFITNEDKCVWQPTQSLIWLGIHWDGVTGTISISPDGIKTIKVLEKLISQQKASVRKLASVIGMIISMRPVIGNLTRIMTRHCQMSVACTNSWDLVFELDRYRMLKLEFWQCNLQSVNNRSVLSSPSPHITFYSDASALACAAHSGDGRMIAYLMFTGVEKAESSTYRELIAIKFALESFESALRNSSIIWFTDSQVAAKIVQVGSMKFNLHGLAFAVFSICFKSQIRLDIQWIRRTLNERADYLSKIVDYDDWEITTQLFSLLEARFGPHTVDCFADFKNHKVPKFYSRFWNPGSAGINAFAQSWEGENTLLVPPVSLVSKVLAFMHYCKAKGTLIVPYWPSAPFWPILISRYVTNVKDHVVFLWKSVLRQGNNRNSILGSCT